MDALRKSNLCLDGVLKFLEQNTERLHRDFADGAVLGVYVDGKDEHLVVIPFTSEQEAVEYRDNTVPEHLREGAVVLPVSANVALML